MEINEEKLETIKNERLTKEIYEKMEKIIDPELGIDIVNLGLVYEVKLYEDYSVEIRLTLTTMGCPFADQIQNNIVEALKEVEELKKVKVKLVWYPAWTPERMSRYARIALGVR